MTELTKIDLQKIRDTLPKHGRVLLGKEKSVCYIDCKVESPSLGDMYPKTFERDFKMIKEWQRQIVGKALMEIYTFTEGSRWRIWLRRIPIEFINASDEDVNNYTNLDLL